MAVQPKPVSTSVLLGMNNRRPDFKLQTDSGWFLRSIVNGDLTSESTIKRRQGYARLLGGTSARSLWSNGETGFFADGSTLYHLDQSLNGSVVRTDLSPTAPVSYCQVGLSSYYTDGQMLRRYDATGDHPAGVPQLTVEPVVSAASGGSMPPGRYTLCFTQVDSAGEESGSTVPVQVVVTAGSISVSGLPATFPTGVASIRIYMSPTNGDQLFRAMVLTAASTSVSFPVLPALVGRALTVNLAPMPAGRIVRWHMGRLFVASGNFLYYSEPFAPHLRNPAKGYIPFTSPVTMMEPTEDGFYVAAGKTYWVAGDVANAALTEMLPYDAVYGASGEVPNEEAVWWMSDRGFVKGTKGGSVENLQEANVAVEPAQAGAALFREHDGLKQALASMFGERPTAMTAKSWMDAEIVRKEEIL